MKHDFQSIGQILSGMGTDDEREIEAVGLEFSGCESPIEEIFAYESVKYLNGRHDITNQVTIKTSRGLFRIDFAITTEEKRVAIECDGKDFHDAMRDEIRDDALLKEGHLDVIYRFRGRDLYYYPEDCLWLMSQFDPGLFTRRGCSHLNKLHKLQFSRATIDSYVLSSDEGRHTYYCEIIRRTAKTQGGKACQDAE